MRIGFFNTICVCLFLEYQKVYGSIYPESMRRLAGDRLPWFINQKAKELKGSFDFICLNYTTQRISHSTILISQIVSIQITGHPFDTLLIFLSTFLHCSTIQHMHLFLDPRYVDLFYISFVDEVFSFFFSLPGRVFVLVFQMNLIESLHWIKGI